MKRLFSPFERIEENRNKTIEGTGLGMSIVMKMLAMMNTKLDVKSVYGSGSEFSFVVEQGVVDWQEVGDINTAYEKSVAEIASYKEKLHASKAHLLFIDDTEMNLEVIKGLLKKTGIKLDTVLSGKAALEKVKENCYDIIFIDHRMPEMDGIETLHAMQSMADNKSKGKPCIALTANAISGVKKIYLNEGFNDYLSKPVNPEKLEDMIRRYLPQDYIEENWQDDESEDSEEESNSEILEKLRAIEGIDANAALANCGTAEILQNAVKNFYNSIEAKRDELESFFKNEDWKNYCTKVHALKSSSRLIGAMDMSQKAAYLEEKSEHSEVDEIRANHSALMELYGSFKEKLAAIVKEEESDTQKPELSDSELKEKLARLKECADKLDMDGMDEVMEEFSNFAIPTSFTDKFVKIRTAADNVDFKELRNLLNQE